eukprot:12175201-Alexandrium_andersonii.AAC.1
MHVVSGCWVDVKCKHAATSINLPSPSRLRMGAITSSSVLKSPRITCGSRTACASSSCNPAKSLTVCRLAVASCVAFGGAYTLKTNNGDPRMTFNR